MPRDDGMFPDTAFLSKCLNKKITSVSKKRIGQKLTALTRMDALAPDIASSVRHLQDAQTREVAERFWDSAGKVVVVKNPAMVCEAVLEVHA